MANYTGIGGIGSRLRPPRPPAPAPFSYQPSAAPNPYVAPTSAPPGSYDPALDAQGENANLGYLWAGQDYTLGQQQRQSDMFGNQAYGTAGSLADILRNAQQQLDAANLSHDRSTQGLQTQFHNLALRQGDAQARAGVDEGGAAAQAQTKRAANQGAAQGQIDENWRTLIGNINYGRDQAVAADRQAFDRANAAADTTFQRAGVTNTLFGQQLGAEKTYSAQQAELLPTVTPFPRWPSNRSFFGPKGARI